MVEAAYVIVVAIPTCLSPGYNNRAKQNER